MNDGHGRKCAGVQEMLSAYLDGELTADDRSRIASHLESCPECRAVLDDLGQIVTAARSLPVLQPPAPLGRETRRRALKAGLIGPATATLTRQNALQAACAALVLLSVAGIVWWNRTPVSVLELARAPGRTGTETSFQAARETCRSAIQLMENRLEQKLIRLPEETRSVFETEKQRIDEVIAFHEDALPEAGRPPEAWEGLIDPYQHKVDFLAVFLNADFGDPQILY